MPSKDTHSQTHASETRNSTSSGQNGSSGASGAFHKDDSTFHGVTKDDVERWLRQGNDDREEARRKKLEAEGEE